MEDFTGASPLALLVVASFWVALPFTGQLPLAQALLSHADPQGALQAGAQGALQAGAHGALQAGAQGALQAGAQGAAQLLLQWLLCRLRFRNSPALALSAENMATIVAMATKLRIRFVITRNSFGFPLETVIFFSFDGQPDSIHGRAG